MDVEVLQDDLTQTNNELTKYLKGEKNKCQKAK
jgi:hypothetical protein